MKVLIASGIFPPDIGGPATYLPPLAAAMVTRGDAVTVVTMSDDAERDDVSPFPVVRVLRRGGPAARGIAAGRALLRAGGDAEVIYAVGLLPYAAGASIRLRRPLVARVVSDLAWDRATAYGWTDDDLETFQRRRYGFRIEWLRAVQRWAIGRARRVVVPSEWLASFVRRLGIPPRRVRVIPNALAPVPRISPVRLEVPTPYLVAAAGRLVPVKRIDLAIRALRGVPDASLLVIGTGPQKAELEHLAAALGLTHRVVFVAPRSRSEALALLAGCDALLLSSAHEGFPHVLLEAMSLGVPVVATAVGGVVEIVADGHNGVLAGGSAEALAGALNGLLADAAARRHIADQARIDVGRRFAFDAAVDATRGVLAEALE